MTDFGEGKIAYEGQTYDTDTNTVSGTVTSGNPVSYYNGTRWKMNWEHGRQLSTAIHSTNATDTTLDYDYDADGIRTSKTYTVNTYAVPHTVVFKADGNIVATMTVDYGYVLQDSDYPTVPEKFGYIGNWDKYTAPIYDDITITAVYTTYIPNPKPIVPETPVEPVSVEPAAVSDRDGQLLVSTQTVWHDYITQNGKVVRETVTTDGTVTAVMDFVYDESGRPFALIYTNGTATPDIYYYVLNLQGDVVKLLDETGAIVAKYSYNAWGEILSVTDEDDEAITSPSHIANINPLRYRSYYYDTDTGFYYLQSRYYDPITHRFINADTFVSNTNSLIKNNMYTYCLNTPTSYCDESGFDAIWIQEAENALGFGHSGLMVQDEEGNWFYFYWGPESETPSIGLVTGTPNGSYVEKIGKVNVDLRDVENVKAVIKSEGDRSAGSASMISQTFYFEGDYTETLAAAREMVNSGDEYRLIGCNCLQQTIIAFKRSDWRFGWIMSDFKTSTIPNEAVGKVALIPSEKEKFPWLLLLNNLFKRKE